MATVPAWLMISRRPRTAGTCRVALVAIRRTRSAADTGAIRTATSGGRQMTPTEHSGGLTAGRPGLVTDLRLVSPTTWNLPARAPVVSRSLPRTAATRRRLTRGGLSRPGRSCRGRSCPGRSCPGRNCPGLRRCRSCRSLSRRCPSCRGLSRLALSRPRRSRRCLLWRSLWCGGLSSPGLSRGRGCRSQVTVRVSLLVSVTTRRARSTGRCLAASPAAAAPRGRERTKCRPRSRRLSVRPLHSDGRPMGGLRSFPVRMLRPQTQRTWRLTATTTR